MNPNSVRYYIKIKEIKWKCTLNKMFVLLLFYLKGSQRLIHTTADTKVVNSGMLNHTLLVNDE